ncbi:MAG: MarR family winged helix-turn-helix transcriptional regulator [Acidobacteriota bacterium]
MPQRAKPGPGALPRPEQEPGRDASAPAREAAEALFEILMAQKRLTQAIAREFGLSLQQLAALRNLSPGDGIPMSVLAEALSCDAANVTGVVDKLEARRLVRRSASRDRRVRLLETTRRGAELREKILARLREPMPWITALASEEQARLRDLLRKGLAAAQSQEGRGP